MNVSLFTQAFANSTVSSNVTQDMIDLLLQNNAMTTSNPSDSGSTSDSSSNIESSYQANINQESSALFDNKEFELILLEDKTLPQGGYMYIYDATPFVISNAIIKSKLPCDEENLTSVNILSGKNPNYEILPTEFVPSYSETENLCNYQTNLTPDLNHTVSEIAILNNSTDDIEFPPTSTVMISVVEMNKTID